MRLLALVTVALLVAPLARADEARPKIAILDLSTEREQDKELAALTGALLAERIERLGAFEVVTQDDLRRLISYDRMKVALTCDDDASCLSEIGDALGARYLVTGSLGRLEESIVVALNFIDIEEIRTVGRETVSAKSATELHTRLPAVITRLMGPVLLAWRGTLRLTSENTGASVFVDDRAVGVIPIAPLELPAGPHRIQVSQDGYVAFLEDVDVPPKGTRELPVALAPLPETYDALWRTAALVTAGAVGLAVFGGALVVVGGLGGLTFAEVTKWSTGAPLDPAAGPLSPVLVSEDALPLIVGGRVVGGVAAVTGALALVSGGVLALFIDFPDTPPVQGAAE